MISSHADLTTRIGTLETQVADQAKRIAALEAKVGITPGETS